jgi:hypothetical protein
MVNADTVSLGRMVQLQAGKNSLSFRIESLYLNPGFYTLGLWMANPAGEVYDTVPSAARIEVVDIEVEGLGTRPKADGMVPCKFDVLEIGS